MRGQDGTRREFLGAVGLGMAASVVTPSWRRGSLARASASASKGGQRRPSFLVILTDDQAYRAIGYNNPNVKTPALDSLAAEGIVFENTYVASPICIASRASLLTGLFPQQHGAIALNPAGFQENVVAGKTYETVAQKLTAAGYHTGLYGKSHLGDPTQYGFQQGEETGDDEAFGLAEDFLRNASEDGKSFLLWIAPHKPHIPLQPAQEWLDLYAGVELCVDPNFRESPPAESFFNQGVPGENFYRDCNYTKNYKNLPSGPPRSAEVMLEFMKAYYATISHLDFQVGQLVSHLKTLGLHEDTVIVFLSDNGYFLGNHGLGNKITMHEESVRVPMFVHWAGLPRKGVRCPELVSSLDLYPTLLELAGVDKPGYLMGKSLLPLFSDPTQEFTDYVASECVGVGGKKGEGHRMVRTKLWKYILSDTNSGAEALRAPEEALFDEVTDPYEMTNLAAATEARTVLARMREHMRAWMDSVGDVHARPPTT